MNLYPLNICMARAMKLAKAGCLCYQQFLCSACGIKQTMERPNIWHFSGRCEECNHVTNIEKDGCNYMVASTDQRSLEALWKDLADGC